MKRLLVVLLAALLTVAGSLGWHLSTSLPRTDGQAALPGLAQAVTVTRDAHGVPHIKAGNERDAYVALGYVHAQDRFWQMEMNRRAGAGRLSQVLGPATLETDKFMRTLGLYRLAEASLGYLSPEVRAALTAYAEGVNSWMRGRRGALPPEFVLLRYEPDPWTPADSLVWARLMGLQLAGNWRDELLRQRVLAKLPADRTAMLWAPYPAGAPTTVTLAEGALDSMLAAIPDLLMPRLASNVWAVAGAHTASGKPVLANDPHLGFGAPILWYLATVEAPGLYVSGATVPGVPFHLLGHNRRIAWGITTTHGDLMDLFVEKQADGGYLRPDGAVPFLSRDEVIPVKGEDPVPLTVRATVHGPIISDLLGERAQGMLLALASATLQPDDRTAQAFYRLNRAQDWDGFTAALGDFHSPQQNFAYADTAGHVGFLVPGRVPVRRSGDGLTPNPGWTGERDWTGWIPYDALPRLFDPPQGRIVNANNKVVPDDYPHLIAATWPEPHRAERILAVLRGATHDPAAAGALQLDTLSPVAQRFKPLLDGLEASSGPAAAALDRLRTWDGVMSRDRPEPLIFEAWLQHLQRTLLEDELGPLARSFTLARPLFLDVALADQGDWCDDQRTPAIETCRQIAGQALETAVQALGERYGGDMAGWRWGDAHQAVFENQTLRHLPLLGWLTTLRIPTGGGDFTVNRGTFSPGEGFTHTHGAGLRAVYDLANLDDSRFVLATGQSGNPLSRHYGDQLEAWRDGASFRIGPAATAAAVLTLEPR